MLSRNRAGPCGTGPVGADQNQGDSDVKHRTGNMRFDPVDQCDQKEGHL